MATIYMRIGLINRVGIALQEKNIFLKTRLLVKSKHTGQTNDDLLLEDKLEEEINHSPQMKNEKPFTKRELEKKRRRFVKNRIIMKKVKNFYREKEPTILTWAARSQIQYLNKKDPIYWTPEMLAQSFPVSVDVIKAILWREFLPPNEKFVQEYDNEVVSNWIQLAKEKKKLIEGRPVDQKFRSLLESDKMSYILNAAGSKSFPLPETEKFQKTLLDVAEEKRPKTRGLLSAILDDYKKDKEIVRKKKDTKYIDFEDKKYIDLLKDLSQIGSVEFQQLLEVRRQEEGSEHGYNKDTTALLMENHSDTKLGQYKGHKFTQNSKNYTEFSGDELKHRYQIFTKNVRNDKRGRYKHNKENSYLNKRYNREFEQK